MHVYGGLNTPLGLTWVMGVPWVTNNTIIAATSHFSPQDYNGYCLLKIVIGALLLVGDAWKRYCMLVHFDLFICMDCLPSSNQNWTSLPKNYQSPFKRSIN